MGSFAHHLGEAGWSSTSSRPSPSRQCNRVHQRRTQPPPVDHERGDGPAGRLADPAFRLLGRATGGAPLSMTWLPRGPVTVRRMLDATRYDAVLARPPIVRCFAVRAAARPGDPPLLVELRDLWAGAPRSIAAVRFCPRFERTSSLARPRSSSARPMPRRRARRHPSVAGRVAEIPNGSRESCWRGAARTRLRPALTICTPARSLRPARWHRCCARWRSSRAPSAS